MNTEAFVSAASGYLPHKDNILPVLFHGNAVILYAFHVPFQFTQFMVMGRKQRLGSDFLPVADILHHSPCNGQPVESACPPADFIQDNQAVLCCISQNIGCFAHFNHKGTLSAGKIIARSDSCKNLVAYRQMRLRCRNKGTDLRHQADQRYLPHIRAFSGHIRPGDNHHPVLIGIQQRIIRNKAVIRYTLFHYRMPSLCNG